MSVFTPEELDYLATQRLGRLATIRKDGGPHISPVGFRYNPQTDTIDIGGRNPTSTKKWEEVQGNDKVSFVVDDVLPPWKPRGIEIRGTAQVLNEGGKEIQPSFAPEIIRITPTRIISWGVQTESYGRPYSRNVNR